MIYVSLDIRIGSAGVRQIETAQLLFHLNIINLLYPEALDVTRAGIDQSQAIDHKSYVHSPGQIKRLLLESLQKTKDKVDLCLIDFTSNPFVTIREPLLLALADGISDSCRAGHCKNFIILLSEIPSSKSASLNQFQSMGDELAGIDYHITIISNSGELRTFPLTEVATTDFKTAYSKLVIELYGDAVSRLERKCIRRLGHFQSYYPQMNLSKCRQYSYLLFDCEDELYELFSKWWQQSAGNCKAILFDLRNNLSFRNVVKAFSIEHSLFNERIIDVLDNRDLRKAVAQLGSCILVVDVVESGITLNGYIESLRSIGIEVSHKIVAAINKGGGKSLTCGSYAVHSFLSRTSESQPSPCIQCNLQLPYTPDSHEPFLKIRSFDMMHMISCVGWSEEPKEEVPKYIGKQYPYIPNFSSLLDEFGDWIAYKITNILSMKQDQVDWFIIHPDEMHSTAISNKLQFTLSNKLSVIQVPREAITAAQKNGHSWGHVIDEYADSYWCEQLKSISGAGGIILDIFNGSGSTCKAIENLLKYFRIIPYCYVCFVDFDPNRVNSVAGGIPKYSLYDWYNPRVLVEGKR